jgi:anti-sigma B factor antagonist
LGVDNHFEFKDKLQALIDSKEVLFVLDLSGVEFIDSTGLGVMTAFLRRLKGLGGNLVLAELQKDVKPIFEITGLKRLFTIADTVEEALRKLV